MSYYSSRRDFDLSDYAVYLVFAAITVVWWMLVGLFHAYDPFRSYLYWWNVNPVAMITSTMVFTIGGMAAIKAMSADFGNGDFNFFDWVCTFIAVIGIVWGVWNMVTYDARVMIALRSETHYVESEMPLNITEIRPSAFAEAQANFNTQNPDARFKIGQISYVHDQWITEYGPSGFWNSLDYPTQGFFWYDPRINPNPQYVPNQMVFAENGIAGNSLHVLIAKRDPFAYYEKVLYTPDSDADGRYMAVISLVKRRGFDAVPYISNVVVIHSGGRQEWLTVNEALEDPRFVGLQIIPEWFEKMLVNAYGYSHGLSDAIFHRTGLVEVQESSTDAENTPPFHMRAGDTMYWVTPVSPLNTPSMTALAWQRSNDINGPVYIWHVPEGKAYPGVDALVATIKTTSGHPNDIVWLINNNGTLSGEIEVLEMLPVAHNGKLYFVGYAALGSKPLHTRMFVTIRAEDSVVMQDLDSVQAVNAWLQGPGELSQIAPNQLPVENTDSLDLSKYSTDELWKLLNQIINEIQKRGNTGGLMAAPPVSISYQNDSELNKLAWRIVKEIWNR
ncbi:MAG: hypothetical protein HYV90_03725 [Candidatus Woesebacteria bacterium]|nr:MAG: hypothetical protein HYV90_03725 [Candidatus Woesebacteria bacterium]